MPAKGDPLNIKVYDPFLRPIDRPDVDPDAEPTVCVQVNESWIAPLLGAVWPLLYPDKWHGTPAERTLETQRASELIYMLSVASECLSEGTEMPLRQKPDNACVLQQSLDGGATWTDVFDFSLCLPSGGDGGPTNPDSIINNYTDYQTVINQGDTYLTQIQNNYNGTPGSVATELALSAADVRDEALCFACQKIVDAVCEAALDYYDEVTGAGNILFGLMALAAAVLVSIALPGISAPLLAKVLAGSATFGAVAIAVISGNGKGPFQSDTAREEFACCLYDKIKGGLPSEAQFTQAGLDCEAELSGDARIIADWLNDSLFLEQDFYLSFLQLANEGIRPVELGLFDCPCDDWCYYWNFRTEPGTWDVILNGDWIAGVGWRASNNGEGQHRVFLRKEFLETTFTDAIIWYSLQTGYGGRNVKLTTRRSLSVDSTDFVGTTEQVVDGQVSVSNDPRPVVQVTVHLDVDDDPDPPSGWVGEVHALEIRGKGTNPFGEDNCDEKVVT